MTRCLVLFLCLSLLLLACRDSGKDGAAGPNPAGGPPTITIAIDPTGFEGQLTRSLAKDYERRTGTRVVVQAGPTNASDRIVMYQTLFGSRSSSVDVMQLDVIWPGTLGEHLVDLGPEFAASSSDFFPAVIANNRFEGRLVAIPWFGDAGVLFYRRDLLEKYGFKEPPRTWDELEAQAAAIQKAEREGGDAEFWGFVWQGAAREALTCNALEWQASAGGGGIIEPDGRVSIDNPQAAAAFDRAARWIGTISPPEVRGFAEIESNEVFLRGKAAFMRNWGTFYTSLQGQTSAVIGKVGIAPLPSGGGDHGPASTIGGWQLGVSRYSLHTREAIDFVRFLTSPEVMKRRAMEGGFLPMRASVYDMPELREQAPWFETVREVFMAGTARPSTVARDRYNEISTIYYTQVHRVLGGQVEGRAAVGEMRRAMSESMPSNEGGDNPTSGTPGS